FAAIVAGISTPFHPPTPAPPQPPVTSPLLRPRCGTHVLAILHQPPLVNLIKFQLFHVIMQHVVFVMLASSANTHVCLSLVHHLALLPPLNSFIAMSGHHRCLASQVLKYYLVMVDDFTHYCWAFPLRHKSEVHRHIVEFVSYAHTQFSLSVKCFQADNGTEFINNATSTFLASRGVLLAPRALIPPHRTARLN